MAEQGKRTKETTGESIPEHKESQKIGGVFKKSPNPQYIDERIKIYDSLMKQQKLDFESVNRRAIQITLKDGKQLEGKCFETTPIDIARKISKKLAENVIVAKVTYSKKELSPLDSGLVNTGPEEEAKEGEPIKFELYDLDRPLEGDCQLELLDFEDPLGKMVFWHSSAHVLGEALEIDYGCHLCIGPPLNNGFYYDAFMGAERVTPAEFEKIEKLTQNIAAEGQKFERIVLSKEEALQMFASNPFKVQLIQHKVPEGGKTTAYRCGKLIDLCTGPHIPSTGLIKALKVMKVAAAYWLGKAGNDDLQRVYGISFPKAKQLEEYLKLQEELAKRDHRNIGTQYDLFRFSNLSPGSAFFFPNGAVVYNKLVDFMRHQYKIRGYTEVHSPNIYSSDLWKISGHWEMYKDNMFVIPGNEGEEPIGLKPMNCPGHCLMFDMQLRSYRDLPMRYADFGVLHRNELTGALTGLTRVRRFQQDDAHIFCRIDQLKEEILGVLDLLKYVYEVFGFEFKLELSTRPEKSLGKKELWDKAEQFLAEALTEFSKPWVINKGDGAFYGPKIDVKLFDSLKREHQCGTIQVDFVLPERFDLQYRTAEDEEDIKKKKQEQEKKGPEVEEEEKVEVKKEENCGVHDHAHKKIDAAKEKPLKLGYQRPVIVHRAILGSVERMFAILCEHYAGKWPFWLSPRQVMICPLSDKVLGYGKQIYERLRLSGYNVDIDETNGTLNKKIRNAQLAQYNYIAVLGEKEEINKTVNLRSREKKDPLGEFTIPQLIELFESLKPPTAPAELNLEKRALELVSADLKSLDSELIEKVFLDGDGFKLGARDKEVFEKLKNEKVCNKVLPNLSRWLKFVKTQLEMSQK